MLKRYPARIWSARTRDSEGKCPSPPLHGTERNTIHVILLVSVGFLPLSLSSWLRQLERPRASVLSRRFVRELEREFLGPGIESQVSVKGFAFLAFKPGEQLGAAVLERRNKIAGLHGPLR